VRASAPHTTVLVGVLKDGIDDGVEILAFGAVRAVDSGNRVTRATAVGVDQRRPPPRMPTRHRYGRNPASTSREHEDERNQQGASHD